MMGFVRDFMTKNFNEAELKELIVFYKSPLGGKTLKLMPQLTQEMTAWMPTAMGPSLERTRVRIREAIERRGG